MSDEAWQNLTDLAGTVGKERIRDLLTEDPSRAMRMVVEGAGSLWTTPGSGWIRR